MRPKTLLEVAQLAMDGDDFDRGLANFLDDFYAAPTAVALSIEPVLLAPTAGELGRVRDAYLAATAEKLACDYKFPVPEWTGSEDRKLHHPWFASSLASLRTVLLLESPAAFRSRNIFISENALLRA
jgi:hypothetical protein